MGRGVERGVEGWEGVRVMFNLWSVFIGNFVLYWFVIEGCCEE